MTFTQIARPRPRRPASPRARAPGGSGSRRPQVAPEGLSQGHHGDGGGLGAEDAGAQGDGGEAGRLKYPTFRGLGLPLGSGAIESNIRRVVNLRLKGNAIYWREENAEAMLQIRALVLTDRWDERTAELRRFMSKDSRTNWRWTPQDMSSKVERAAPNTT